MKLFSGIAKADDDGSYYGKFETIAEHIKQKTIAAMESAEEIAI